MTVALIDYGSGNLRSAAKAIEVAARDRAPKTRVVIATKPGEIADASHVVLPGVGAFADCMRGLEKLPGMIEALEKNVIGGGKPFLGICVGMQLMAERGLEHGVHKGLGWIAGEVRRIAPSDPALKIPHMGWNDLRFRPGGHAVLAGLEPGGDAYFVHSYSFVCPDVANVLAEVDYGGPIAAVVGRDNLIGTQFHPEKSQALGLRLIGNFLGWRP
jgi:glutamine amidotransferase